MSQYIVMIECSLQPMLDVPIYGRIATLELFRPHVSYISSKSQQPIYNKYIPFLLIFLTFFPCNNQGEAQDFLFIATERYKFCVLQWDTESSELITRFEYFSSWLLSPVILSLM